jgi:ABC-type glycerol-3-phosphate transport system permease component
MEQNKFNVILKKEDYEKLLADSEKLKENIAINVYVALVMSVVGLMFGLVFGYGISRLADKTECVIIGIVALEAVLLVFCQNILKPKKEKLKNVQKEKIKN